MTKVAVIPGGCLTELGLSAMEKEKLGLREKEKGNEVCIT